MVVRFEKFANSMIPLLDIHVFVIACVSTGIMQSTVLNRRASQLVVDANIDVKLHLKISGRHARVSTNTPTSLRVTRRVRIPSSHIAPKLSDAMPMPMSHQSRP